MNDGKKEVPMSTSSTWLDDVLFDIHDIATLHHGFVNPNNHSSEDPIFQLISWLRFYFSIKVHKLSCYSYYNMWYSNLFLLELFEIKEYLVQRLAKFY